MADGHKNWIQVWSIGIQAATSDEVDLHGQKSASQYDIQAEDMDMGRTEMHGIRPPYDASRQKS